VCYTCNCTKWLIGTIDGRRMLGELKMAESGEKHEAFAIVTSYFANRQRDPRNAVTKISILRSDLAKAGHELSHEDISAVFEQLEAQGAGVFRRGRPRAVKDRFEWSSSARDFAEKLLSPASNSRLPTPSPSTRLNVVNLEHKYRLRANFEVMVVLPADINRVEATRFAEFIRTLPFDDGA